MSFIGEVEKGVVYAPGYFLAHEECVRKTFQFKQTDAVTVNGKKCIPAGVAYSVTEETEVEGETTEVTTYIGIVYEDVDVTTGDMPGSVVTQGVVYENRLPALFPAEAKTALTAKGITFIIEGTVTRPNWTNE